MLFNLQQADWYLGPNRIHTISICTESSSAHSGNLKLMKPQTILLGARDTCVNNLARVVTW